MHDVYSPEILTNNHSLLIPNFNTATFAKWSVGNYNEFKYIIQNKYILITIPLHFLTNPVIYIYIYSLGFPFRFFFFIDNTI